MKIAAWETFVVGNPPPHEGGNYFIFVKLVTDDGIVGYGECYVATFGPDVIVRCIDDMMERRIVGRDPHRIEEMLSDAAEQLGLEGQFFTTPTSIFAAFGTQETQRTFLVRVEPGDLAQIRVPIDFVGINYYSRGMISADGSFDVRKSGLELTDMDWEIYPRGLTDLLVQMHRDYPALPPVYITENGGAFKDDALAQGRVQDDDRIAYLREHIAAVARAMQQGVPMAGYMVWSLMDNFEWASGYLKRFGIVHVDYATQARTPKASAEWYRQFLRDWRG